MSEESEKTKRIVLVGYPGSGKTMLAIGLHNSGHGRKGVSITVADPKARDTLAAYTSCIDADKKFPLPTTIPEHVKDLIPVQSERVVYPFEIVGWRGEKFRFDIEDYAGERTSNPNYEKEFVNDIIAKEPFGVVLLLNPGMGLFKEPSDSSDDSKKLLKLRSALPKSYMSLIEKACEVGCKHFVLAVTASDRISRGGDLFKTAQHKNFMSALKEISDYLKSRLSVENKKVKGKNNNEKLDYTILYITVTGQLTYKDGEAQEVRLAKGSANTAADPFLWIIDPWRMRFRNLVKHLMWIVPSSLLLLASMYVGAHVWNGYKIKNCLDQAESALAEFGDPEALNFNNEKGSNCLVVAENHLQDANEREWFVADKHVHAIDERLPTLLATLMTNQVWLAYKKNSMVDQSDYNEPHMTLKGQTEFVSWLYWARSTRGKASYEAAKGFRDQMTMKLSTGVLESNVKYLIGGFGRVNDYGKQHDKSIKTLFKHTHSCSNDMVVTGNTNDLDNLISLRDNCLQNWMRDVSSGISANGAVEADIRISSVITKDTGLDRALVRRRIFASHRDVELRDFKVKASECEKEVLDGNKDLQTVAAKLFEYLSGYAESPYTGIVLGAAKKRFNEAVSNMLTSADNREELFDQTFRATCKLSKLSEKVFDEECFGDNALYWLAATITNGNGKVYQYSTEWLRYNFECDAVAVRTDHVTNNPGAPVFKREVDANMTLSWPGSQRKIGDDWLIKNSSGEAEWTLIRNSGVHTQMAAMDILRIDVDQGEEDWKYDVDIPAFYCSFSPGWNDIKRYFPYKSKTDVYPKDALYWVRLHNVHIENGPYAVFSKALKMAREREDELNTKRGQEVMKANAELERCTKEKEGGKHE